MYTQHVPILNVGKKLLVCVKDERKKETKQSKKILAMLKARISTSNIQ